MRDDRPPASARPPLARTAPPSSGPGIRKPALAERNPELLSARLRAAHVLDEYCRRRNISTAELALCWKCSEGIARDLRSGQRDLRLAHLMVLPRRHARALLDALHVVLDEADAVAC